MTNEIEMGERKKGVGKYKLLVMVDSPTIASGFSKVGVNLVRRWGESGEFERIDIWGVGYRGFPGKPGTIGEEWWQRPAESGCRYVLYPLTRPGVMTADNLRDFLQLIVQGDYTHIWIVQDHFLLVQHGFAKCLLEATNKLMEEGVKKDVRVVYYCPVDGEVEPEWASIAQYVDRTVAYTVFGRREMLRQLGVLNSRERRIHHRDTEGTEGDGRFGPEIGVIPHGCDTTVFRPLEYPYVQAEGEPEISSRDALREQVLAGFVKPGDVLLLNVNVNQRRKDVTRTLEILANLKKYNDSIPFKLLMHMNQESTDQIDLAVVGRQLGLVYGVDWIHTGHLFKGHYGILSERQLNEIYNCGDVYITTTLGEGWGFGITEAAAAGCHIAVPGHTACEEIAEIMLENGMGARVLILPLEEGRVWIGFDNCRGRQRVDVMRAVAALRRWVELQRGQGAFDEVNRKGLSPVVVEWLDWDRIAARWMGEFFPLTAETQRAQRGAEEKKGLTTEARRAQRQEGEARPTVAPCLGEINLTVRKRPVHYYLEYGGGLGDVFNGLYRRGSYNVLRDLKDGETATVSLVCSNPGAREIFETHPKVLSGQVQVLDHGYWDPKEDRGRRRAYQLPFPGSVLPVPDKTATIREGYSWYPHVNDRINDVELLKGLWSQKIQYFVVAAGAGLNERNIPGEALDYILSRLVEQFPHCILVLTGRDFERHGRVEPGLGFDHHGGTEDTEKKNLGAYVVDLRNKLSVPGTCLLMEKALGLVTCHSALNILGWHQVVRTPAGVVKGLPQLLLYPEQTRQAHFDWLTEEGRRRGKRKDQWSMGVENGKTAHGLFGDYREVTERFVGFYRGDSPQRR